MEQLLDGIQFLSDFFGGFGEFSFFQSITSHVLIWWLKVKLAGVVYAWGVAQAIIVNIGISSQLNSAWSSIDSTLMSYLTVLKIPDAINVLLSAQVTRFVMGLLRI